MAVRAHRITIEPTSIRGERGQYYRVYFEGAVLIEDTWNPEFEACRALVARGITGRLETWRAGKSHPGMIVPDIEEGARWTVVENDKEPTVLPSGQEDRVLAWLSLAPTRDLAVPGASRARHPSQHGEAQQGSHNRSHDHSPSRNCPQKRRSGTGRRLPLRDRCSV
jgi:hypothetical protein